MNLNKSIYILYNMSSISQLKKTPGSIKFKITNKKEGPYEVALINALRRSIIVHLEVFCFLRETINFNINTSIYNEDFLSQRVGLIPLNYIKLEKLNVEEIEGHLNASNDDPVEYKRFYARDIILYQGPLDSPIEDRKTLEDIYPIPDILLLELKPGQKLKFTIRIGKGTHKENGAMFCPISKCVYYFENDQKALQQALTEVPMDKKQDFTILNGERYYLKLPNGLPQIFNFEIETDGVMPIGSIFLRGCDYLLNLIRSKVEEIKNIETSTIVAIETSPTNMKGYDFVFENSNETLGNIIQSYGLRESSIHYIAYQVPHPLDKRLYVRVSLKEAEAPRKDYEKVIIKIMNNVIDILETLKKDYSSALK